METAWWTDAMGSGISSSPGSAPARSPGAARKDLPNIDVPPL